jgi:hypothetical protein
MPLYYFIGENNVFEQDILRVDEINEKKPGAQGNQEEKIIIANQWLDKLLEKGRDFIVSTVQQPGPSSTISRNMYNLAEKWESSALRTFLSHELCGLRGKRRMPAPICRILPDSNP